MTIKEIKSELVGREMSFMELDNKMMEFGFYSVMDDGVTGDVKECSNVCYLSTEDNETQVIITFEITIDNGAGEAAEAFELLAKNVEEM